MLVYVQRLESTHYRRRKLIVMTTLRNPKIVSSSNSFSNRVQYNSRQKMGLFWVMWLKRHSIKFSSSFLSPWDPIHMVSSFHGRRSRGEWSWNQPNRQGAIAAPPVHRYRNHSLLYPWSMIFPYRTLIWQDGAQWWVSSLVSTSTRPSSFTRNITAAMSWKVQRSLTAICISKSSLSYFFGY